MNGKGIRYIKYYILSHPGTTVLCIVFLSLFAVLLSFRYCTYEKVINDQGLEESALSGTSDENHVFIGDEEIDYSPGEYGDVCTSAPDYESFSTREAAEEYYKNWHSRSQKKEVPSTGRYLISHYEKEPDFQWVDGEIIVIASKNASKSSIEKLAESQSYVLSTEQELERKNAYLLYCNQPGADPLEDAYAFQQSPEIVMAFPNIVATSSKTEFDDPYSSRQSYVAFSKFNTVWSSGATGKGATIAVLDSGIDTNHEDLTASIDYENAYDAIERHKLSNGFIDTCGHGTIVSGIAAATAGNGKGITGCAPNATILPIRVLDESGNTSVFEVSTGIAYISGLAKKPDAVDMSFESPADSWFKIIGEIAYYALCQDAIDSLSKKHSVSFIAAAGNDGRDDSSISYPAALTDVIGVGATDDSKQRASFSSANRTVDICALGTKTYSTVDTASVYGNMELPYADEYWRTNSSGQAVKSALSGTSFAAPQVSAAAAMLRAQNPSWTAQQIEDRLESTAVDLGDAGRDDCFGYGLLDAAAACAKDQSTESGSGTGSGADTGTSSGKSPALGGSIAEACREVKNER